MSAASTYEPFAQDPLEEEAIPVKRRTRRSSRAKKAGGGAGRTLAIVLLVLLAVAIVVLAITLPIVFTRRMQQNAANGRTLAEAQAGQPASGASGPAGAPVPGSSMVNPSLDAGVAAVNPAGPNLNTGDDVFCYRSPATGQMLDGAFRKTGAVSEEDGISRTEVQSCGSGSKMFVLTSALVTCQSPCQTPAWMAVSQGLIDTPIWNQPYVCRGDQVYDNRMSARYTFYWRYAGYVEEQLITRCDTNDAWWVPNLELRYCTADQVSQCQLAALNRVVPKGNPVLVPGVPAGTVQTPRPVCQNINNQVQSFFATGVSSNSYVWTRARFMDQIEVTSCQNRTGDKSWISVDEVLACPPAVAAACAA